MRAVFVLGLLLTPCPCPLTPALEPKDVIVVANKSMPASRDVARHYLAKRNVPVENLIELDLPTGEDISRADYDAKLAGPLREALKDRKDAAKVLLTVYGVPLRVGHEPPTADEKKNLDTLRPELTALRKSLAELEKAEKKDAEAIAAARNKVDQLTRRERALSHAESQAAVDSELMLLWWPKYPLVRWVANPLNWQFPKDRRDKLPAPVIMTCRLDGPTPEIAKRLVDDAVAVEEAGGLKGKVFFDARGSGYDPKQPRDATGYGGYDESFREAAALLKAAGMDVTLDNRGELFAPKSCKEVALYAGWYSHANFIDSSEFVKGAVAWHLASSEAVTLRKPDSKVWCPNLLKAGVAATLGPVAEPYTIGFPKAEEFFGFLATGKYTLVECYARTTLLASWMGVLVGDPLYNPFAKSKPVKEEDVFPSPKGAPPFSR